MNNSNHNSTKNTDKSSHFSVYNEIPDNLSQVLVASEVYNSNYDNTRSTDETSFLHIVFDST